MPINDAQADDFGKYARNPETWVVAARRSLAIARLLMNRSAELRLSKNRDFFEFSGCYYAGYFHAGVALENAAKAVLISRDPTIVSKGTLDVKKFGSRSGHALLEPAQSILGSLTKDEYRFVTKLEEFVWAGRYTVPTKADVLYDEERMNNVRLSTPDELEILQSLVDRIMSKRLRSSPVRPSIGDFRCPIQQYCTQNGLPPLTALLLTRRWDRHNGWGLALSTQLKRSVRSSSYSQNDRACVGGLTMQWSSPLARIRLPQLLTAALGAQHERYESISIFFNSGFSE